MNLFSEDMIVDICKQITILEKEKEKFLIILEENNKCLFLIQEKVRILEKYFRKR